MMVCLDDCPPNDFSRADIEKAVERTIAWAKRCKIEYDKQLKKRHLPPLQGGTKGCLVRAKTKRPLIFGVIQGGAELDLRERCTRELVKLNFDGYGFGARHVDKNGRFLAKVLKFTADLIPNDKIKFALGVGLPEDIVRCYQMGWEMFDCVIPTREGRHGKLFFASPVALAKGDWKNKKSGVNLPPLKGGIKGGRDFYKTINIGNARFAADFSPINKKSALKILREHSLAYLHHLFKIKDPLGARLASLNNLEFYSELIKSLK
jgi:queuine tRNA-ribosyltransferase